MNGPKHWEHDAYALVDNPTKGEAIAELLKGLAALVRGERGVLVENLPNGTKLYRVERTGA